MSLDENVKKLRRALTEAGITSHELVVEGSIRQVRVPVGEDGTGWVDIVMIDHPEDGWAYRLIYSAYGHAETVAATDEPRDVVALIRRRMILADGSPVSEADWLADTLGRGLRKERA
ncbi:hypothetical protein [Microbispora sp. NPDC049633]|uniref:hypothetical protein n=1 Tax=Microbispora sp. NPDC049633 TaxID=3154355 RepID=UPI003423B6B0